MNLRHVVRGAFDRLEDVVERHTEKPFDAIFRSRLKAVDVASSVRNAMDRNVDVRSSGYSTAPNAFTVSLSRSDFRSLAGDQLESLRSDIERLAQDHAEENGYALVGPIEVEFRTNDSELTGELEISASFVHAAAVPATGQVASDGFPIVEVDGQRWILNKDTIVIGRGHDADIQVADPHVSRRHLELQKTPNGVVASDLGSANGLLVEGHRVDAATLQNGNQLTIGRTTINFWTAPEEEST